MPIKKQCIICGKDFITRPSFIKKGGGRFCSFSCSAKWKSINRRGENSHMWKGGKTKRICSECGKEFLIINARKDKALFCSRKCKDINYSKNNKMENNPNWKGGGINRTCPICKKEFRLSPYLDSVKGKCCSKKCSGVLHSKRMSGKNNPAWAGGLSFEEYPVDWTDTLKRSIKERDGFVCKMCGAMRKEKIYAYTILIMIRKIAIPLI